MFLRTVSQYRHDWTGKDYGDAQIVEYGVVVAMTDGRLGFGTYEQIFYVEFDRRRKKRVV